MAEKTAWACSRGKTAPPTTASGSPAKSTVWASFDEPPRCRNPGEIQGPLEGCLQGICLWRGASRRVWRAGRPLRWIRTIPTRRLARRRRGACLVVGGLISGVCGEVSAGAVGGVVARHGFV